MMCVFAISKRHELLDIFILKPVGRLDPPPRGGQEYWHSFRLRPMFLQPIPNFFDTIEVILPIISMLLRTIKRRMLPINRAYLIDLLVSGLYIRELAFFKGCCPL